MIVCFISGCKGSFRRRMGVVLLFLCLSQTVVVANPSAHAAHYWMEHATEEEKNSMLYGGSLILGAFCLYLSISRLVEDEDSIGRPFVYIPLVVGLCCWVPVICFCCVGLGLALDDSLRGCLSRIRRQPQTMLENPLLPADPEQGGTTSIAPQE